ncbi:MAG TPA: homoserine dehydrogenase [Solirubrobacterales bacterium]|nr:homoserine dehydrogenase [Solirubrobacterales bacterium]
MARAARSGSGGETVRIGILGRGTVGGAFKRLLGERAEMVAEVTGKQPRVSGVLSRGKGDFGRILSRSDVIVELMGGLEPARSHVERALRSGKHVVTANKQLIAQHGPELVEAAREGGAQLRFEAAVAGAIPVIRVVQESLGAIPIEKVFGIVNGTTNYILTEMARGGLSYDEALRQAQELGYAEADPTEDVNGADAAAKMVILARLAFGAPVRLDQVPYEGIERIQPDDLAYAKELGLSLKLLGVAERIGDEISVRVFPCFLYPGHPLAPIEGPFNAVMVEAPTITEITMSGPGAGGPQTASAVLGDVVSVINGGSPLFEENARHKIAKDLEAAFYLHLEVEDRPGVLARIAEVLGENEVSVRSVVQRGTGGDAQLIMVMHRVSERRFNSALKKIGRLRFLRSEPRAIRVIEEEFN